MSDAYDLACYVCGLTDGADLDVLEESLWDEFGIELDAFQKIVDKLLPLIDVGKSPVTGQIFKGFSDTSNGYGLWLSKIEINVHSPKQEDEP